MFLLYCEVDWDALTVPKTISKASPGHELKQSTSRRMCRAIGYIYIYIYMYTVGYRDIYIYIYICDRMFLEIGKSAAPPYIESSHCGIL